MNEVGTLVARGTDTLAYDQAHRLTRVTPTGSTTPTAEYAYDGDGGRFSSTVGATTTRFVHDTNRGLPMLLDDGQRQYVWGPGLTMAISGAAPNETVQVHHKDALGSVRAITDAAGAVVQRYATNEFGGAGLGEGTVTQPFGFTGQYGDADTGLQFLRARMYDPALGRFLQRDPYAGRVTRPSTLNRYTYASNNPVTRVDPSGLDDEDDEEAAEREARRCANPGQYTGSCPGGPPDPEYARGDDGGSGGGAGDGGDQVEAVDPGGDYQYRGCFNRPSNTAPGLPGCGGGFGGGGGSGSRTASTSRGQTIQDFETNPGSWRQVAVHGEPATGRAYRGGTSVEEVFEKGGDRIVRHRIYDQNGSLVHETHREYGKFGE